jgi:polysaccharide export outer membrane protein
MFRFLWLAGSILIFLSSCVTNKKFTLLQKEDLNKKDLPKDTAVRKYTIEQYDYRIQSEDIISVRFESLTNSDFDFLNKNMANQGSGGNNVNVSGGNALLIGELVDQNGEIPFPFIGKVKVAGLTIFQIQDKIQEIAKQYLESPVVKVRLLNFRFTILGEVNKEGTIVLNNNRVDLLEAIGWAGGMTDLADKANVKLIRHKNGETTVQYINLLQEDFINSPYFYVHQNDVIMVPPLKQRPYRKYFGENLSLIISSLSLLLITISLINSN